MCVPADRNRITREHASVGDYKDSMSRENEGADILSLDHFQY